MHMATILTYDEVKRLITTRCDPRDILVLDDSYSLVDDTKAGKYFKSIASEAFSLIGPWMENVRDCDKFSRVVACISMLSHMRQSSDLTGLALGVFAYRKDSGENHAINFMMTKVVKKEKINIRLFEPQTGEEVFLTDREKTNVHWTLI